MISSYTHIFIHMEAADFVPGKAFYAGKLFECFHLRSSRSEDYSDRFMSSCQLDQSFSRSSRSGCAGCFTGRMDLYFHTPNLVVLCLDSFFGQLGLLISCLIDRKSVV